MIEELPKRVPRPELYRFRVLEKHIPFPEPNARWLDLGGGAGEFSSVVASKGYQATLVDGDARNTYGEECQGVEKLIADLNEPLSHFENSTFDGVSLIEVVEHIPFAERLMQEARRVLKSDGTLLLSTPNSVWWPERLRALGGQTPMAEGYHYRFFNVAAVRAICEDAGFEIVRMEFSSPAFGINWVRRRILRRSGRTHVKIMRPYANLLAQTIYVVGRSR